jgi:hypothetical protein
VLFSNVKAEESEFKELCKDGPKGYEVQCQSQNIAALFRCIISTSEVCFGEMFSAQILYYNLIII